MRLFFYTLRTPISKGLTRAGAHAANTKDTLVKQGAAECMIECMAVHPDDQYIQASGCSMILSLATTRANRRHLVDIGALASVVRASQALSNSSQLGRSVAEFARVLFQRYCDDGGYDDVLLSLGVPPVPRDDAADASGSARVTT